MVDPGLVKYVPVVKWRQGEKDALKHIDKDIKDNIAPLIELVNDEGDDPNELAKDISVHWRGLAYLDVYYRRLFGPTALDVIINANEKLGIDIIPVVRLDSPSVVIDKIKEVALMQHNGFALRLEVNEVVDYSILEKVDFIISQVSGGSTAKNKVDLIIDFGFIETSRGCASVLKKISQHISMAEWRRVIISSGAFPQSLQQFKPDEDNFLDRLEIQLWRDNQTLGGRKVIFSDYTVRSPLNITKPGPKGSISVRYTLEDKYQIFRGAKSDPTFKYLAHAVNIRSLYGHNFGNNFSWGDETIDEKATQLMQCLELGYDPNQYDFKPGRASDWVAVSVNHHISVVLKNNL